MSSELPGFPVFLLLEDTSCLVVGGEDAAESKARALVRAGAKVTVIASEVSEEVVNLANDVHRRDYVAGEAASYRLVIAATGIEAIDHLVAADAQGAGVLVNVVDDQGASTFIMPAVLHQGGVTVAVSTAGASPAFATWLRDEIATGLGTEIGDLLDITAMARSKLRSIGHSSQGRPWREFIDVVRVSYRQGGMPAAQTVANEWVTKWLSEK